MERVLEDLLSQESELLVKTIEQCLEEESGTMAPRPSPEINPVDLNRYDYLIGGEVREWLQ